MELRFNVGGRSMRRARRRRVAAVAGGLLLVALAGGSALGAGPTRQTFHETWDFVADGWCNGLVRDAGTNDVLMTTFTAADGNQTITLHIRTDETFTSVETGRFVHLTSARTAFNAFTGQPTFTGALERITDSNGRLISQDAGYITVNFVNGEIVVSHGMHPAAGGIDFCPYLEG